MMKQSSQENIYKLIRRNSRENWQSSGQLYRPEFSQDETDQNSSKLWNILKSYKGTSIQDIQKDIVTHLEYTLAKNRYNFGPRNIYQAVAHTIKDKLIETFNDSQQYMHIVDPKRIYYLSLEFLLGRWMQNCLINMRLEKQYGAAIFELGQKLEEIQEQEQDPGLGNGGLGRLAACFLDSLATLEYPAWGYGIRYNYGIFKQKIQNGYQVEIPDYWLAYGNPWEIERTDVQYHVHFYGYTETKQDSKGKNFKVWVPGQTVIARAYDNPLPGYNTFNSINLRLWRCLPLNEFEFQEFNKGDYFKAIESRQSAENISSVLYPNDNTMSGKELRLKQQYFFVSATIQDVLRRFKSKKGRNWDELPDKMAIQLNDTHPAIAIVELMRVLIDIENLEREYAFDLCYKIFAYTNHTILPEALEKWSVELLGNLLPRHLELIYEINYFWLQKIQKKYPENSAKLESLSIVQEHPYKAIRMANLCIVGSHAVNGVAALHTELLKTQLFKDFYEFHPKKFQNKTNGVTPRRWVRACNPGLTNLYNKYVEESKWVNNLEELRVLASKATDEQFQKDWALVKLENKRRLAKWVKENTGVEVCENSLFDIQVKRIHEYKRQLMNALYIIHRYLKLKDASFQERKSFVKRTSFIGGKAAPGYYTAKKIIKLVNSISEVVNNDKEVNEYLKVVFLPNYCVSAAEIIVPANDINEQISTAGTEASGTSNMKFVLNGGIIIGTMDGANVEIAEEIKSENMFIFGAKVEEIDEITHKMRTLPPEQYIRGPLLRVFRAIDEGMFGQNQELKQLIDTIRYQNDQYLVCHDFYSYCEAQDEVDRVYQNQKEWNKRSILNAVLSSKFSSDRTIHEYAKDIWDLKQVSVPNPAQEEKERLKFVVGK